MLFPAILVVEHEYHAGQPFPYTANERTQQLRIVDNLKLVQ